MRKVSPSPSETVESTLGHIEQPAPGGEGPAPSAPDDADDADDADNADNADDADDADEPSIPSLFDLLGHSLAAAHATSAAVAAQLNVALAAYRLLQVQRGSLGTDSDGASEALRRILDPGRRDGSGGDSDGPGTGGETKIPRTFGERRPGTQTEE